MSKKRKFWRRNRFVHALQYAALRYIILFLTMFPLRAALSLGKLVGRVMYRLDRRHRTIAYDNLKATNLAMSDPERHRCIQTMYEHLGLSTVEILFLPRLFTQDPKSYITFENFGLLDEPLKKGRGVIVVIAHLGNWELTGIAISQSGYPLHSLARPIENPYVDRYLNRFRTSRGQDIIVKYNALPAMTEVLMKNEFLVVQIDQDARKGGVFVDFLGRAASTTRSPALLSLRYGSPILPVLIYRESLNPLRHKVVLDPLIYPDAVRDAPDKIHALTQLYTSRIESFVRRYPEQWIWLHRRWKTRPPEEQQEVESAGKNTSMS